MTSRTLEEFIADELACRQLDTNGLDVRRRNYVTASEVPQILGISPWGNAADVWHRKVYGFERESPGNDATEAGKLLEPVVVLWGLMRLGVDASAAAYQEFVARGVNAATVDARIVASNTPIEAKTHGIVGRAEFGQWGDAGTNEVPDNYLTQVQTQLIACDADKGYMPALIGGRGFVLFEFGRDEEFCRYIQDQSGIFMEYVSRKICPPAMASVETLKRIKRRPQAIANVDDAVVLGLRAAQAAAREAEKVVTERKSEFLQAIGDAEAGECSLGMMTFLARKDGARVLNWKAKR